MTCSGLACGSCAVRLHVGHLHADGVAPLRCELLRLCGRLARGSSPVPVPALGSWSMRCACLTRVTNPEEGTAATPRPPAGAGLDRRRPSVTVRPERCARKGHLISGAARLGCQHAATGGQRPSASWPAGVAFGQCAQTDSSRQPGLLASGLYGRWAVLSLCRAPSWQRNRGYSGRQGPSGP